MKRYAMPVDPRILEKDFKSSTGYLEDIQHLLNILGAVDKPDALNIDELFVINKTIKKLWFKINARKGINLRDREKLYPVFKEMNRVFKGNKTIPVAYRGVRMPLFSPRGISNNDPEVKEILEGLAYGLRSWTQTKIGGLSWAKGLEDSTSSKGKGRDKVVFQIENPTVVLDCSAVIRFYFSEMPGDFFFKEGYPFDHEENILKLDNPKVVGIEKLGKEKDVYLVKIKES